MRENESLFCCLRIDLLLPNDLSSKHSSCTLLFVFWIELLSFLSIDLQRECLFLALNNLRALDSSSGSFLTCVFSFRLPYLFSTLLFLRRKSNVFLKALFSTLDSCCLIKLLRGDVSRNFCSSLPLGLVNKACSSSRVSSMLLILYLSDRSPDYILELSPLTNSKAGS